MTDAALTRRPMAITLRRAAAADAEPLAVLQQAAYARNREIMGVEPLPLRADYGVIIATHEVWLCDGPDGLAAALILEPRADDLLVWSIAVAPGEQRRGIGNRLIACAEDRAASLDRSVLRLYTNETMSGNVAWYQWHGYAIERIETLPDRRLVHMAKRIG